MIALDHIAELALIEASRLQRAALTGKDWTMGYSTYRDEARAFAERVKALGFVVYMAESGTYGFVTDASESRVLSFGLDMGASLSGNYGPPSTTSGTGWRMDKTPNMLRTAADVQKALYAHPPVWCGNGWKYLSTVKQYLAHYGASSRFVRI